MEKFNESIHFDKRMWHEDITGSIAYAKANAKIGILTDHERDVIINGLNEISQEWANDQFELKPGDEDIHTANERRLTELVGKEIGGKLHTGRSRNDQVATDTRLWTVKEEVKILENLAELLNIGANFAKEHVDILCAGYTHLQPAQPIRFSHWILSHLTPIMRDAERLKQMIPRANQCPLGSGALAGNAFNVDRDYLAQELKFDGVTLNSLDAVCDRDFIVEFLNWHALFLTHVSQFAEDLIILNLQKTVIIADAYATGSSLMPQKKNPDALELLRGKAGVALGRSVSLTCTLKGLPRAYNKDLQEDKPLLFAAVDTVHDCVAILSGVLATLTPVEAKLVGTLQPEMLATDLAEYLVLHKQVPFRETHHISGACVRLCEDNSIQLNQLSMEQLQSIDERLCDEGDVKIMDVLTDYSKSVERKQSIGGTSRERVLECAETCLEFAKGLV
uniref:Argininosuccinate lyase n=1 Tax=Leptocylindrus danicus TaxID=163516 RepID=A0A7S2L8J6_9STRA